jgi:uncharacterized membrane protein
MENITPFLGRFHPLIVHLPIGILMMAAILQLIAIKSTKFKNLLDPAISITLFWGGLSSIGAVSIGWLLSLQGGYDTDTLFWHKWLGITVTVISFLGWLVKSGRLKMQRKYVYTVFISIIVLITITGHLGGSLTHGDDYLFVYSPNIIKKMVGIKAGQQSNNLQEIHPDSIQVYSDVIQPILDAKCVSCHNTSKKQGGLLLTTHKNLMKGGDNGSIVDSKSPLKSEFLNRVTLPKNHKKFMPPKGAAFTFGEIQIFEWWMKSGADSISKFSSEEKLDKKLIHTLLRDYKLDYNPRPYYEKVQVDSLPISVITELRESQFVVDFMGEHSNMLSIDFNGKSISKAQLEKLLLAKEQITWLNLSNCNLSDAISEILPKLPNLTRLNIHSNPITDKSIKDLNSLKHLTSVNVYNTQITNTGFQKIVQLKSLSKLFVWQTAITVPEVEEVATKYPKISIISGIN